MLACCRPRAGKKARRSDAAKAGFLNKFDKSISAAGKAIWFAVASTRAKMIGKSYVDILNFLQYEFTFPETEDTWKKRQDLLISLSEVLETRKEDSVLPKDFVEKVKVTLPDIVGAASSERTTLSSQGCRALQNIARHLETQIQPQLDILLPALITLCGSTKSVNQKNASETILNICKHAGYSHRLFYHICSASKDRRNPPRIFAPEWLRILLKTYRGQMDRNKDGELAQKAIYEGLRDGQVKVRENSRAAYWEFATYDVAGARMIMGSLNSHAQAALRDDPHNPDRSSAKAAKAPRPGSALASIKAQSKQQLQQHRGNTPASVKSTDFAFGPMEEVHPAPASKNAAEHDRDKQDRQVQFSTQHSEQAAGSRHGSRPTSQKSSKDSKIETTKDLKTSSPQVEARPLLSAPVRRGRIIATPIAPMMPSQRPCSRGESCKKPHDTKDKHVAEKSSGRQTPVTQHGKENMSSTTSHHRKTASRHETIKTEEQELVATTNLQYGKKTGRQTPVIAEDKEPSAPPTPEPLQKEYHPVPAFVEDKAMSAPGAYKDILKEDVADTELLQQRALPPSLPLRPVQAFAPENQFTPPPERAIDRSTSPQHIPDGKENTDQPWRKKHSPNRSPMRPPKRTPQRRNSIASAKKHLATAIELLRHGTLDALGYRRLRMLFETHPQVLITGQEQFNELFELLIANLSSLDEISEPREKRVGNLNHPAYNRHTIVMMLSDLFQQYPQWPEPQPGMTLSALIIARCNHTSSYASAVSAIEEAAMILSNSTQNPLATIDVVLDTMEEVERIIITNDPIITPRSTTTQLYNSLQSVATDFGPEKPRFAVRLPIIMAFGINILIILLSRVTLHGQTLFTIQEDRLASYAEHLLTTYTSVLRRYIMNFCTALHAVIKPEKRFYNYFSKETDKNLIHYYVAGASGPVYGSLGDTGRVVMPGTDSDFDSGEPGPTYNPNSDVSANWKLLSTTHRHGVLNQHMGNMQKHAAGNRSAGVAIPGAVGIDRTYGIRSPAITESEDSGNIIILGITEDE
ncbi:suppressor of tub2 mutation [Elasticomyces elasticus]|uniref:Suppressor of tub2 mutation n=1 Tax=Exophiala sideris TaxID=1016849 RepID=A0ABR0JQK1_9EURO|nr:suppressor of tub2 mutation [Elasticomyces elasticus]KAK5039863.1 suppressor of tub2 mutation [Exophiala sideris]KAK5041415.1 suppressor of tub2 mutation [Exophiala sideris]KAK5068242.1 suppressor of tub2 mutation [Exophiala sideris]KAK5187543.1 suppressor of tub2 mutation [Eurotiomycetes sp. CCFEE 6388]